jgi:hypothetical protein
MAGKTGTQESSLSQARRSEDPLPHEAEPTAKQVREQEAAQQEADDARREEFKDQEREALIARDRLTEDVAERVEEDRVLLDTGEKVTDHPDTRPAGGEEDNKAAAKAAKTDAKATKADEK